MSSPQSFQLEKSFTAGPTTSTVSISINTTDQSNSKEELLAAIKSISSILNKGKATPEILAKSFPSNSLSTIQFENASDLLKFDRFYPEIFSTEVNTRKEINNFIDILIRSNNELMIHFCKNLTLDGLGQIHLLLERVLELVSKKKCFIRYLSKNNTAIASCIRNGLNPTILSYYSSPDTIMEIFMKEDLMKDRVGVEGALVLIKDPAHGTLNILLSNIASSITKVSDVDSKRIIEAAVESIKENSCGTECQMQTFEVILKGMAPREIVYFIAATKSYFEGFLNPENLINQFASTILKRDLSSADKTLILLEIIVVYPFECAAHLFKGIREDIVRIYNEPANGDKEIMKILLHTFIFKEKSSFSDLKPTLLMISQSYPTEVIIQLFKALESYSVSGRVDTEYLTETIKVISKRSDLTFDQKQAIFVELKETNCASFIPDVKLGIESYAKKSDENAAEVAQFLSYIGLLNE